MEIAILQTLCVVLSYLALFLFGISLISILVGVYLVIDLAMQALKKRKHKEVK